MQLSPSQPGLQHSAHHDHLAVAVVQQQVAWGAHVLMPAMHQHGMPPILVLVLQLLAHTQNIKHGQVPHCAH